MQTPAKTEPTPEAAEGEARWSAGRARRHIVVARVDPSFVRDNYLKREWFEALRFYCASVDLPWYRRRGGWDLRCRPFDEHPTFRFLQAYYESGFDPAATERYQRLMQNARQRGSSEVAGGRDPVAVISRYFDRRRALFENMARDGYRAGMARDEIGLAIGRDGRLIKTANGNNRMAVARILGLDSVTVELRYVHERWYRQRVPRSGGDFRHRIATAFAELPGVLELDWTRKDAG